MIPWKLVGYELLDSRVEHRVSNMYHKLISNKHEWDSNFSIYYQTLDKNILNFILHRLKILVIWRENFQW